MASQGDQISAMVTRMSELKAELDNRERALEESCEKQKKLEDSVMELTSQLIKTRTRLDETESELNRVRLDAAQIDMVVRKLEEVEHLKQRYDQRINKLRARIIELQNGGKSHVAPLHFDDSDSDSSSAPGTDRTTAADTKTKEPGSDWLQSLPNL